MYLYMLAPIDHGWDLMRKADINDEHFKNILDRAKKHGWEGDFTEVPRIMILPPDDGNGDFIVALVWKQSNNGSTFVASMHRLPYLGEPEEI